MFCTIISNMESWKEVKAAPLRKVTIVRVESWLYPTLAVWLSGKWQNVAGVIPEGGRAGTPYCGPCACLCTLFASSQLHRQGGERSRVFIASDQPPPPFPAYSRVVRDQPVLDRLSGKELSHKAGTNLPFTTIFIFFSGIGQGRVTSNLQGAPIDNAVFVSDKEAVEMVKLLFLFPRTYVKRVRTV